MKFICVSFAVILGYIIAFTLYISMPQGVEYTATMLERGILIFEYIVCAFSAVIVFLLVNIFFVRWGK